MKVHGVRLLVFVAALSGCLPELTLPIPPDVIADEARYRAPTVTIQPTIIDDLVEDFQVRQERINTLDRFNSMVSTMSAYSDSINLGVDEDDVPITVVNGLPIQADAAINLQGDCPGWQGARVVDAFALNANIDDTEIIPVIWGPIKGCRVEPDLGQAVTSKVEFNGAITGFLTNFSAHKTEAEIGLVIYIKFGIDTILINDNTVGPWVGDFRLFDDALEILAEADNGDTAIIFERGLDTVGIRGGNGEWECQTKERRCDSTVDPTESFDY